MAKPYLKIKDIGDDELLLRFRIVGGSIREIIEFDEPRFSEKAAQACISKTSHQSKDSWMEHTSFLLKER